VEGAGERSEGLAWYFEEEAGAEVVERFHMIVGHILPADTRSPEAH
jgi:hypothetical protein